MNKVVLYLRVSTKEQLDGSSIEVQDRICRDFAFREKFGVSEVFTEKGESAKTANRTELKKLLDYVVKNHKDLYGVMVHKLDRLTRNSLDHAQLKMFFNKYGMRLISATENLEDTPVGRLIETQLSGFAQFDNEVRTERSVNGMIAAVKIGRYVWKAPLGFINTGGRGTSNLAHDNPEIVKKIKRIWEWLDTGYAPEKARKMANKDGLNISKSQFHRMLRNKVYMGIIEKFGLSIVGNFDPLIEPQLFLRVLNKIGGKKTKLGIYRVNNPDFPIRGLVLHEVCGEKLTASWNTGNGGKYPNYHCRHCKKVNFDRKQIESDFIKYLNNFAYQPKLKVALLKAIEANLEYKNSSNKKRLAEMEKEILSQKTKIRQITEKNFKGVISDNLAKEMIHEAEQIITVLSLEKHGNEVNNDEIIKVAERSLTYLEDVSGLWLRLDPDVKVRFQKFLFPSGVIYDGVKFRTDELALCIALKRNVDYKESHVVTPEGFEPSIFRMKT